jgi:hypothetical protein
VNQPKYCPESVSVLKRLARHCKKAVLTPDACMEAPVADVIDGMQLVA